MADTYRTGTGAWTLRRGTKDATAPPPTPDRVSGLPGNGPQQLHRGMTLVATISLFIGTRSAWTTAMASRPAVAGVISVCYASILICAALSLLVRSRRALIRVDAVVLMTAVALVICGYLLDHAGTDEGVLTAQAANEILHGRPVYGQPWPWLFGTPSVGITKTMSGGADYTYGYPPLTALLAAPVHAVVHSTSATTLVTTAALLVSSVLLWFLLPAPWRPAATAVCLGFGLLPHYAYAGYPAITALALLVPVVVRWPATGAGWPSRRRGSAAGGVPGRCLRGPAARLVPRPVPADRPVRRQARGTRSEAGSGGDRPLHGHRRSRMGRGQRVLRCRGLLRLAARRTAAARPEGDPARAGPDGHLLLLHRRQQPPRLLLLRQPAAPARPARRHPAVRPAARPRPHRPAVGGVLPRHPLPGRLLLDDDPAVARGRSHRPGRRVRHRLAAASSPRHRPPCEGRRGGRLAHPRPGVRRDRRGECAAPAYEPLGAFRQAPRARGCHRNRGAGRQHHRYGAHSALRQPHRPGCLQLVDHRFRSRGARPAQHRCLRRETPGRLPRDAGRPRPGSSSLPSPAPR